MTLLRNIVEYAKKYIFLALNGLFAFHTAVETHVPNKGMRKPEKHRGL